MDSFNNEMIIKNLKFTISAYDDKHVYSNWTRVTNALICIKEGKLRIESNKGNVTAVNGECIFVPVGAVGSTYFIEKKNIAFIFFFDTLCDNFENTVTLFEKSRGSEALINNVLSDCSDNRIININYYYSAFYQLIYQLQESRKIDKKYEKIHSLVLELERNYSLNLKISDYAKMMLMSESGLRSLFKEYTGKTIIEYRNDVRLKRAEEFILSGMKVSEAADMVGFSSSSYYCRISSKKRKK